MLTYQIQLKKLKTAVKNKTETNNSENKCKNV